MANPDDPNVAPVDSPAPLAAPPKTPVQEAAPSATASNASPEFDARQGSNTQTAPSQGDPPLGTRHDAYIATAFLLGAISDMQGTIRAIDIKANALLVTMALLIVNVGKLGAATRCLLNTSPHDLTCLIAIVGIIGSTAWVACVWLCLLTLAGKYNPSDFVSDSDGLGSFYAPGRFRFHFWGTLFTSHPYREYNLDKHLQSLPKNTADEYRELSFEQLKLALIRDLKASRTHTAFRLGTVALITASILWFAAATQGCPNV